MHWVYVIVALLLARVMVEGGPLAAATSSHTNSDVNEEFLRSLMEMGIHREDARQVVFDS